MKAALWAIGIAFAAFVAYGIYMAGFYPALAPKTAGGLLFGPGTLYGRRISTASWQASYDSITASSDQSVLNLEGVHDGIVDKDGKPYLNVAAQHLTVNTQTHDFIGTGKIRVISLAADTSLQSFECSDIAWSDNLHRLTIQGPVKLESGASEPLVVAGLTFDVKAGQLHLGPISGAANFRKDASVTARVTPPPIEAAASARTNAAAATSVPATAIGGPQTSAPAARTPAYRYFLLAAPSAAGASSP